MQWCEGSEERGGAAAVGTNEEPERFIVSAAVGRNALIRIPAVSQYGCLSTLKTPECPIKSC